jgi:hypothetical protein
MEKRVGGASFAAEDDGSRTAEQFEQVRLEETGMRQSRVRSAVASVLAATVLLVVAPSAAHAEDDFWGLWGRNVIERPVWEVPFAIIISLPAMIVTTPFWAGGKAIGAIKRARSGRGEDKDS